MNVIHVKNQSHQSSSQTAKTQDNIGRTLHTVVNKRTTDFNQFPAKPPTWLVLSSSISGLRELLKRSEMFTFRNQFHLRMYQRLEFTQEVSIQHPIAAYKLHTVCFATDLI